MKTTRPKCRENLSLKAMIFLSILPFFAYSQPEQPTVYRGCPEMVLPFWLANSGDNPHQHWPNFGFGTLWTDCYNCDVQNENEVLVCEHYFPGGNNCPACLNVTRITDVYNPRTGNYETVYMVVENDDGITKVWYTYYVYKVPIYATDSEGKKWIIGWKYYWNLIPDLIKIATNPSTGNNEMEF